MREKDGGGEGGKNLTRHASATDADARSRSITLRLKTDRARVRPEMSARAVNSRALTTGLKEKEMITKIKKNASINK